MKEKKVKIVYDFEEDVFLARPLERDYDSSFQIGNFIFDLDKNKIIQGIEIIGTSKLFGVPKVFLRNMFAGKIELIVSEQRIQINIQIKTKIRNTENISSLSIERVRPEFINPTELRLAIA